MKLRLFNVGLFQFIIFAIILVSTREVWEGNKMNLKFRNILTLSGLLLKLVYFIFIGFIMIYLAVDEISGQVNFILAFLIFIYTITEILFSSYKNSSSKKSASLVIKLQIIIIFLYLLFYFYFIGFNLYFLIYCFSLIGNLFIHKIEFNTIKSEKNIPVEN